MRCPGREDAYLPQGRRVTAQRLQNVTPLHQNLCYRNNLQVDHNQERDNRQLVLVPVPVPVLVLELDMQPSGSVLPVALLPISAAAVSAFPDVSVAKGAEHLWNKQYAGDTTYKLHLQLPYPSLLFRADSLVFELSKE